MKDKQELYTQRVIEFMQERKLTKAKVSRELGVTPQQFSKVLKLKSIPPSIELAFIKTYGFFLDEKEQEKWDKAKKEIGNIEKNTYKTLKHVLQYVTEDELLDVVARKHGYKKTKELEGILKANKESWY